MSNHKTLADYVKNGDVQSAQAYYKKHVGAVTGNTYGPHRVSLKNKSFPDSDRFMFYAMENGDRIMMDWLMRVGFH